MLCGWMDSSIRFYATINSVLSQNVLFHSHFSFLLFSFLPELLPSLALFCPELCSVSEFRTLWNSVGSLSQQADPHHLSQLLLKHSSHSWNASFQRCCPARPLSAPQQENQHIGGKKNICGHEPVKPFNRQWRPEHRPMLIQSCEQCRCCAGNWPQCKLQ